MEQEVVKETTAEKTVETAPTTVEAPAQTEETVDTTPASESTEPAKVSETVPYDRFSEVNAKAKAAEERAAYLEAMLNERKQPEKPVGDIPQLDPDAQLAVDYLINQRLEQRIDADFTRNHSEELSDPLIKAAYNNIISEKMTRGEGYIDRENSLKEAKDLIESRLKQDINKAKVAGVEEGQKLAQAKDDNSAIGETAGKIDEKSDDQLSAAELAKKYGIPRSENY